MVDGVGFVGGVVVGEGDGVVVLDVGVVCV